MRELKFRAWDEDKKEMFMVTEMNWKTNGEFLVGSDPWYTDMGWAPGARYSKNIMQYTGHKDRNNKEIYEGDILRGFCYPFISEGKENYYALIDWSKTNAGFYSYPIICSDRVRGRACEDHVFEDGAESSSQFEIIGNIFENPELIKF